MSRVISITISIQKLQLLDYLVIIILKKERMQQQALITNQQLFYPYLYQQPLYLVRNHFTPFSFQNVLPLHSLHSLYFKFQNNQQASPNSDFIMPTCDKKVENVAKTQQIEVIKHEQEQNMKKVQKFKLKKDQQQFLAKKQIKKPEITYKKKNTESNIMNQTFSYIRDSNSLKIVRKLLLCDEYKINEYYNLITRIKKQNKKYVNRKFIKRLMQFLKKTQFDRIFNKCKLSRLSIEEVRVVLRKLIFYYLRDLSFCTLLTSSKIHKDTIYQHYWRKRQIFAYLFPNPKPKTIL